MATRSQGVLDKMTKESGVETATLKVFRYRPEVQTEPYVQEYKVPYRRDMVVLDALNYIKDHIDGTLSYRWSCRMGICGSCGADVDGEPKLTCASFLHEFKGKEIKIEPLANFPVIKDLIINIEDFMEKLDHIKPWIIRKEETPLEKGEYRQTPEELEAYKQFSMCINCMLCYAACPIYGMNEEFLGPAATALAYRYIIRELTSFFISIYAIIYIYQLSLLASGDFSSYDNFVRNPATIGFSIIALFFTLYHAVTWFSLMGRIQVVKLGPKKTATPLQAIAINLLLLLIVSYAIVYLFILR